MRLRQSGPRAPGVEAAALSRGGALRRIGALAQGYARAFGEAEHACPPFTPHRKVASSHNFIVAAFDFIVAATSGAAHGLFARHSRAPHSGLNP